MIQEIKQYLVTCDGCGRSQVHQIVGVPTCENETAPPDWLIATKPLSANLKHHYCSGKCYQKEHP